MANTLDGKSGEAVERPVLSITIPTYQRAPILKHLLLEDFLPFFSSLSPEDRKKLEIVISDNGSKDDSWDVITEFKKKAEDVGVVVKTHRYPQNQGYDKNIEAVLNLASGRLAWFMPDDFDFNPGLVKEILDTVVAYPDARCAIIVSPHYPSKYLEIYGETRFFENAALWCLLRQDPELLKRGFLGICLVCPEVFKNSASDVLPRTYFTHYELLWRSLLESRSLLVISTSLFKGEREGVGTLHFPWTVVSTFYINKLNIITHVEPDEDEVREHLYHYKTYLWDLAFFHHHKQMLKTLLLKGHIPEEKWNENFDCFDKQLGLLMSFDVGARWKKALLPISTKTYGVVARVLPNEWSRALFFIKPIRRYVMAVKRSYAKKTTWDARETGE